jgi:hypothetical protein
MGLGGSRGGTGKSGIRGNEEKLGKLCVRGGGGGGQHSELPIHACRKRREKAGCATVARESGHTSDIVAFVCHVLHRDIILSAPEKQRRPRPCSLSAAA